MWTAMTEHTTIQITKAQASELDALRTYDDEPYKSVLARLLEANAGDSDAEAIAAAVTDDLLSQLPPALAAELQQ